MASIPRSMGIPTMLLLAATVASGCANLEQTGTVYDASQLQRPEDVSTAFVERVRPVQIDERSPTSTLVGEIGGGLLGAVAGSAIGGGRGSLLTGVAGGLAGGLAGHEIEDHVDRKPGFEITVRLLDGRLQAITQPASEGDFYPGQRIRLLRSDNGSVRVTH